MLFSHFLSKPNICNLFYFLQNLTDTTRESDDLNISKDHSEAALLVENSHSHDEGHSHKGKITLNPRPLNYTHQNVHKST